MNKNTKSRQKFIRATAKVNGGFSKPVYKAKKAKFPAPNKDSEFFDVSMANQTKFFNGQWAA